MYVIDRETKAITLPRGDTLAMQVRLTGAEFPEGTVAVLGVCSLNRKGEPEETVLSRAFPVRDGLVAVRLTNRDTRDLAVGSYAWDLRLVTDPEYDADGNVRCDDDTDGVISAFSGGAGMPGFLVTGVAVDV